MSNKGIKINAKFDGKEKEFYRIKRSKDGSQYIIPKNSDEKGKYVSVHPSGIVNIRSKTRDSHNVLSKLPGIEEFVKKKLEESVKIIDSDYAVILDYAELKNSAKARPKEHFLDMDEYFEKSKKIIIKNDNFDFIDEYLSNLVTIYIFNKNGEMFLAVKNKKGYGIPTHMFT